MRAVIQRVKSAEVDVEGSLLQAAREHSIDLKKSFMVGDSQADMEMGRVVASKTILIRSLKTDITARPDAVVANLLEAAEKIVGSELK